MHESLLGDAPCKIVTTNGAKLSNRYSKKCDGCQRRLRVAQKSAIRAHLRSTLKRRKLRLEFQQKLTDLKERTEALQSLFQGGNSERSKSLILMKELLDDVTTIATELTYGQEPQGKQNKNPEDKYESLKRQRVEKPSPTEAQLNLFNIRSITKVRPGLLKVQHTCARKLERETF